MLINDLSRELASFISHVEKVFADNCSKTTPNLTPARIEPMFGPRYVRLVKVETFGSGRSAYAFVDRENGDILFPAGWKGPAKHARGNILKPETYTCAGPYGLARLR